MVALFVSLFLTFVDAGSPISRNLRAEDSPIFRFTRCKLFLQKTVHLTDISFSSDTCKQKHIVSSGLFPWTCRQWLFILPRLQSTLQLLSHTICCCYFQILFTWTQLLRQAAAETYFSLLSIFLANTHTFSFDEQQVFTHTKSFLREKATWTVAARLLALTNKQRLFHSAFKRRSSHRWCDTELHLPQVHRPSLQEFAVIRNTAFLPHGLRCSSVDSRKLFTLINEAYAFVRSALFTLLLDPLSPSTALSTELSSANWRGSRHGLETKAGNRPERADSFNALGCTGCWLYPAV